MSKRSSEQGHICRSRKENLACAMKHESNGNLSAAYECYQKAVDISPSVAYDLIQVLKQKNVSYVVAPYEADAQMTFLALSKQVEAVITEDSDLIAFGCPRILYKMDKFGQAVEFRNSLLPKTKEIDLTGFTQMMLLEMCILSGCDYLQSLPGMGLKKAYTLMKKFKNHEKVIKQLKYNGVKIPPLFEESFRKAIMTFKHQRVYDPVIEDLVHLSEPVYHNDDNLDFLGPSVPQLVAKGIAHGDLDPFTKTPIQQEFTAAGDAFQGTYQFKSYKPGGERKHLDLPVQKNLLTNYFCFASLEAKRKFRAPRIAPKHHPKESNETSRPHIDVQEVKFSTENLMFLEASESGLLWIDRHVADYNEMQSITNPQDSVCKPCISLQKDLDSDRKDGKLSSGNKNVIVRSRYFQNKSRKEDENEIEAVENGDAKFENVSSKHAYKSLFALSGEKCREEEKRVTVRSSHFQKTTVEKYLYSDEEDEQERSGNKHATQRNSYSQKSIKENKENEADIQQIGKNQFEDAISQYAYKPLSASSKVKFRKDDKRTIIKSSYFQHKYTKEDANTGIEKAMMKDPVKTCKFDLDDVAHDTVKNNNLGTPSYNSMEFVAKKRKVVQIDIQEKATDIARMTGTCSTTDLDEENKADNEMFSSNIAHLNQYSDIAEKSMERFISLISSFRYNPSGSRVSGLRAPLRDIKNTRMQG